MRVFMTGGTGWVGSVVVDELLGAGHQVHALVRSEEKAAAVTAKGGKVLHGTLDDIAQLAEASAAADAVIHAAFDHDFSRFAENSEQERRAIEAMTGALAGSDKRFLYTSGLAFLAPGRIAVESDQPPLADPAFPRKNENAAAAAAERGIRVGAIRLAPTVHGIGDRMFMAALGRLARDTGVSAYVGDGANRWPAVHVSDAGRLYRKVLEADMPGTAFHANAEEGVAFRDIAEAIGQALGVPVGARPPEHFGWLGAFAVADAPASSARTRELTGWNPVGPMLLADLAQPNYFGE